MRRAHIVDENVRVRRLRKQVRRSFRGRKIGGDPGQLAFGNSSRISRSAVATLSWPRPLITTAAPARASPSAMARPIPAVDPVTTALRPLSSIFMAQCLSIRE